MIIKNVKITGIEIRLDNSHKNETYKYEPVFRDDFTLNMQHIDSLLYKNITITNCDHFMLYYIINLIMRYYVAKNNETPVKLKNRLNLNHENVVIVEIDENGNERRIQGEDGLLLNCYFGLLMRSLMDDFDNSINYYETE